MYTFFQIKEKHNDSITWLTYSIEIPLITCCPSWEKRLLQLYYTKFHFSMKCTSPVLQERKTVIKRGMFTVLYFKLPGFKLLCLVAPNRMTRTSLWIAFGGLHFLLFLTFLVVYVVEISAFLFAFIFQNPRVKEISCYLFIRSIKLKVFCA